MADVIMASGSYPKDANRFKVALMLMAGAEVGFGVAQAMRFVTPPIDGKCNLYGDSGLALVYQSGLLDGGIKEWIEGEGDDRKAKCTVKRVGQPERTFEYPLSLAKKLHSYKFAHKVNQRSGEPNGGPWYDDTDNMLRRRALWRALNAVFADTLNGMTADDVAADEAISVEVVANQPAALPAATPPAATPPPVLVDAQPAMTDEQFTEVKRLREVVRTALPDDGGAAEWKEMLAPFNAASVKDLTPDTAAAFILAVGRKHDPLSYPPPSSAAA